MGRIRSRAGGLPGNGKRGYFPRNPILAAAGSALLFGLSTPAAKILLADIPPIGLAGLLYIGAFFGIAAFAVIRYFFGRFYDRETRHEYSPVAFADVPWLAGAVAAGGIAGPILLMMGLARTSGFSASLLLNLEAVATALLASLFFGESAGKRIWLALGLMTAAGVLTTAGPAGGSEGGPAGPLLIGAAMVCWGLDNNMTRKISDRNPLLITAVKGLIAGSFALALTFILGTPLHPSPRLLWALAVGAGGYGVSLVLFICALRDLGSIRTGTIFSLAPFLGAMGSLVFLHEKVGGFMAPAALLMFLGMLLTAREKHAHLHRHQALSHAHPHTHDDGHHDHGHDRPVSVKHVHLHEHAETVHVHEHRPDVHHRHEH